MPQRHNLSTGTANRQPPHAPSAYGYSWRARGVGGVGGGGLCCCVRGWATGCPLVVMGEEVRGRERPSGAGVVVTGGVGARNLGRGACGGCTFFWGGAGGACCVRWASECLARSCGWCVCALGGSCGPWLVAVLGGGDGCLGLWVGLHFTGGGRFLVGGARACLGVDSARA